MLDGPGNADRDVAARGNRLAGRADLLVTREAPVVHGDTARPDGGAEHPREGFEGRHIAHPVAARHNEIGLLERDLRRVWPLEPEIAARSAFLGKLGQLGWIGALAHPRE